MSETAHAHVVLAYAKTVALLLCPSDMFSCSSEGLRGCLCTLACVLTGLTCLVCVCMLCLCGRPIDGQGFVTVGHQYFASSGIAVFIPGQRQMGVCADMPCVCLHGTVLIRADFDNVLVAEALASADSVMVGTCGVGFDFRKHCAMWCCGLVLSGCSYWSVAVERGAVVCGRLCVPSWCVCSQSWEGNHQATERAVHNVKRR